MGEERLHLRVQLRSESLVMTHDEGRPVELRDDVRDGKGLTATGYAQQHLRIRSCLYAINECLNGLRLIASGFIWRFESEQNLNNRVCF